MVDQHSDGFLEAIRCCRAALGQLCGPRTVETKPAFTFKMEEHVRLVVLEHLRDELGVHVLRVDFLEAQSSVTKADQFAQQWAHVKGFVQDRHGLIKFLLRHVRKL